MRGAVERSVKRSVAAAATAASAAVPPAFDVWMSHFDAIVSAPAGFRATAATADAPVAALEDPGRGLYGVQFHPERSGEYGARLLQHFVALISSAYAC